MRVLYFSWIREQVGIAEEEVEVPESVCTGRQLIGWLSDRDAGYANAFAKPERIRCAVDQQLTTLDAQLTGAQEVAFFPPMTGG